MRLSLNVLGTLPGRRPMRLLGRPRPDVFNPELSPASCYERRSSRCAGAYSRKPLRHSVNYAFSVLQSVRHSTAASRRPRDGAW